jgi:glucose dehydrogenase
MNECSGNWLTLPWVRHCAGISKSTASILRRALQMLVQQGLIDGSHAATAAKQCRLESDLAAPWAGRWTAVLI